LSLSFQPFWSFQSSAASAATFFLDPWVGWGAPLGGAEPPRCSRRREGRASKQGECLPEGQARDFAAQRARGGAKACRTFVLCQEVRAFAPPRRRGGRSFPPCGKRDTPPQEKRSDASVSVAEQADMENQGRPPLWGGQSRDGTAGGGFKVLFLVPPFSPMLGREGGLGGVRVDFNLY
jgi:hypothetical protein